MRLSAGMVLGRFEILAPIGAGGMGEVYRARDRRLSRDVAVKILAHEGGVTTAQLRRFEQEARALAALAHPNVVVVHDLDVDPESGAMYIATELLEGESLRSRLDRGPLPWRTASAIVADMASGLAAAHQKEIVHRDVKPDNVFLTSDGVVKLLDFGLARNMGTVSMSDVTAPINTTPGMVVGTVSYMSPEQARGESVTAATDIFSTGTTLFELVTGRRPFDRSTGMETLAAIFRDEPQLEIVAGVPPQLVHVIRRCLEKSPEQRYASARDLAHDLRALGSSAVATPVSQPETPKIAVLPFENIDGDVDADYLSDGITESIIARLARLPRVRVVARSTVFRHKGSLSDPRQIGAEIGAQLVVTGRVRLKADKLVIGAELVDVSDGAQLWGERFLRRSADLLEVEDEIAEEITAHLQDRLGAGESGAGRRRETEDVAAYHSYLRGRFYWNKRNESALHLGLQHFRDAIEQDPGYALAWVGIADSWNILGFYSLLDPRESFPRGEAAARKALAIDPALAEGRASLGYVTFYHHWDAARSESMFREVIQQNPSYPAAHQFFANQLTAMGRFDEAIREFRRALELDPLSLIINVALGWCYYYQRDFSRAVEQINRSLLLDQGFGLGHLFLSRALLELNDYEGAVRHAENTAAITASRVETLAARAAAYHRSGDAARGDALLDEILREEGERFVQPYDVAIVHASAGRHREAIAALERAVEIRSHRAVFLAVEPAFDAMREEREFSALVARVGISSS